MTTTTKIAISNVTQHGATISLDGRPGVPLSWQELRDAAAQADASLARAYSAVLAEARHAARHLMAQRWEGGGYVGPLRATGEDVRDRLIADAERDGYRVRRDSIQLVTLDPDQVAEEPQQGRAVTSREIAETWGRT